MNRRAFLALPILLGLGLAGCGGGSNGGPAPIKTSPLLGRIAYTQSERVADAPGGADGVRSDIYLRQPASRQTTRLTPANLGASNDSPAVSPDGTRVAFVSRGSDGVTLYSVKTDGTDLKVVLADATPIGDLAWTPDGSRIAYSAFSARSIFVVNADGSGSPDFLLRDDRVPKSAPTFSPDGLSVAYTTAAANSSDVNVNQIFIAPLDNSSSPRRLTNDGFTRGRPAFSPDGRQIAFAATAPSSVAGGATPRIFIVDAEGRDVNVANVDGSDVRTVAGTPNFFSTVSWSPDGLYLTYAGNVPLGAPDANAGSKIYITRADGAGTPRVLTSPDAGIGQFDPSWGR